MDAQRTTELEPASGENTSFSTQQERHHRRRGPPARRPTNPPAPRVAPPIPPGGSHPSPAQQQANNFDRLPLGSTLKSRRGRKVVWRKIKGAARKWWSKRHKITSMREEGDEGGPS
ncbi:uncharacterized protein LTHEOB_7241 [Lasiodiplodia theobromae]|uniref:uncharacterized protein n=1 Tax=Lasiodiplodia theobromae TaxID=45133 RepID=UPI0015C32EC4|nr:uncharacterized protein LTHEOB_7241 [Lasiodiplodia theobromae]KAF4542987.1 hypothetical protein LTHEOB_7241 [Lasiodiplodia theobromae]